MQELGARNGRAGGATRKHTRHRLPGDSGRAGRRDEGHGDRKTRPIDDTRIELITDYTHDVFDALVVQTEARDGDMLLMGWQGEFDPRHPFDHAVQHVMSRLRAAASGDPLRTGDRGPEAAAEPFDRYWSSPSSLAPPSSSASPS